MSDMKMLRDQRDRRTATARPQMSLMGYHGSVHGVRGTEYGAEKYARGNYHGAPPEGVAPEDRIAGYIDAALRHLMKVAQAYNFACGTGGDRRAALSIVDDEASGGFPPSLLPHLSHAVAGLKIAIECAVHDGILPADPGQPWKQHPMYLEVLERRTAGKPSSSHYGKSDTEIRAEQGLPQKDDPDAERRRVERLTEQKAGSTFEPGRVRDEGVKL